MLDEDFSGQGAHGVVRRIELTHKDGSKRLLALKTITKRRKSSKMLRSIESEVQEWLKVVESPYVPYFYACFEDEHNKDNDEQYNTVYII